MQDQFFEDAERTVAASRKAIARLQEGTLKSSELIRKSRVALSESREALRNCDLPPATFLP